MFREDVDDGFNHTQSMQDQPVSPTAAQFGAGDVGIDALAPTIAFTVLATVVVFLRWYARCKVVRHVGADDYVILLSLVSKHNLRSCLRCTMLTSP